MSRTLNQNRSRSKSPRSSALKRDRSLVRRRARRSRPVAAYRQRGASESIPGEMFNAPEIWHEPVGSENLEIVVHPPGQGYVHPVTAEEVRDRVDELSPKWTTELDVVQFSPMTRKRTLFPCYGMQWGATVYLYPIEESLVETYARPPRPEQQIEAKMFGGKWRQEGHLWLLEWTENTIRDFYLNNILIHEIGHINDQRNTNFDDRERYANWFATEYGYRPTKHLRSAK